MFNLILIFWEWGFIKISAEEASRKRTLYIVTHTNIRHQFSKFDSPRIKICNLIHDHGQYCETFVKVSNA